MEAAAAASAKFVKFEKIGKIGGPGRRRCRRLGRPEAEIRRGGLLLIDQSMTQLGGCRTAKSGSYWIAF
jgi:hypothetical protein